MKLDPTVSQETASEETIYGDLTSLSSTSKQLVQAETQEEPHTHTHWKLPWPNQYWSPEIFMNTSDKQADRQRSSPAAESDLQDLIYHFAPDIVEKMDFMKRWCDCAGGGSAAVRTSSCRVDGIDEGSCWFQGFIYIKGDKLVSSATTQYKYPVLYVCRFILIKISLYIYFTLFNRSLRLLLLLIAIANCYC